MPDRVDPVVIEQLVDVDQAQGLPFGKKHQSVGGVNAAGQHHAGPQDAAGAVLDHFVRQDIAPLVASIFGFAAGAIVRFLTAYLAVFEPAQPWARALPRFLASLLMQGAGNAGLLWLLLALRLPVWVAQLLVTGAMTIFNFVVYRLWVFR